MKELIVHNRPKSPISEAYRSIRTNIQFANVDGKIKTILFTSATAGEGKTTTLSNVAMTLVDAGHRVLIIDCDLRKPRVHKFFEISNEKGITDILLNSQDYREYLHKNVHSRLHIIPSGKIPGNPSELLYSEAMKTFIGKLKADYDYIFVDSPPVLPVTDAAVMSTYMDAVILVCASGQIEIEAAKRASEALKNVKANLLGAVINKIPIKESRYSSYYYYYANEEGEKK